MRMTKNEELIKEVENKLNQFDGSYTIANFETVHKLAVKIAKLGYKVEKTSANSYLISRV